jgi:hypothetical protein
MTPSTDWRETIPEGEDAQLERLGAELAELQARRKRGDQVDRALHAKGHVGLRATFTVGDGLPEHARQGVFARPRAFAAFLRLSNGGGARVHDKAPDVRGLAVKLLDVDGAKVLGDARTQDFLAIDSVKTPFRDPQEFVTVVKAAAGKNVFGGLVRGLGLGRALGLGVALARGLRARPNDLLDVTFNTVLPIAFGPYAARLAFVPLHAPSPSRAAGREPDYLSHRIAERAAREPLRWEVRAQFYTGAETPIEDPRVDWPSPYTRVAELVTIPATPTPALTAAVEALSFDPWHALTAHRPLGAMMRARKHAYFASTKGRGAAPEPDAKAWERLAT